MVTIRRWQRAQQYEEKFWANLARKIECGTRSQLGWYAWKATELESRLQKYVDVGKRKEEKVLEIGSGPIGIVNFLERGQCFAIDPLEHFYQSSNTLTGLRKSTVTYLRGNGEELPFAKGLFSLVIIDNVIDHTFAPCKILKEIHRVLDKNGFLYLSVNIRTNWGTTIHRLLASCYVDRGHPHSFTKESIRNLLTACGFELCEQNIEDYCRIREKNCNSKIIKEKLKGYAGISEFEYLVICRKSPETHATKVDAN